MHLDVTGLNNFYSDTVLGQFTKRRLHESIKKLWGNSLSGRIVGYGFAPPILSPFIAYSANILCLMPGHQGVMAWPTDQHNCSVLVEETSWPLATGTIDRLVILHGLETSENLQDLFQEIWRVLAPSAKVIFIVPNRSGWWARTEATPFGQGRPFSIRQLKNQLESNRFKVERHLTALHAPPIERLHLLRAADFLENFGGQFYSPLGAGILLLEATKQIYALNSQALSTMVSRPINVLEELTDPRPVSKGLNG